MTWYILKFWSKCVFKDVWKSTTKYLRSHIDDIVKITGIRYKFTGAIMEKQRIILLQFNQKSETLASGTNIKRGSRGAAQAATSL